MPHVNQTPNALWLSGAEALHITNLVYVLPHAINPAEAESFFKRLRVSNALFTRRLLVKADKQFLRLVVILLKPLMKIGGTLEEFWVHS